MKNMNRRQLFATMGGVAAVSLLAGCVTTKDGNTTSVTLNVKKVNEYIKASRSATKTMISMAKMVPVFAPYVVTLDLILDAFVKSADEFSTITKGQVTISYTNGDVMTIVNSVLSTIEQLYELTKKMVSDMTIGALVPESKINKADSIYNSLQTLISIFRLWLSPSFAQSSVNFYHAESLALRELNA